MRMRMCMCMMCIMRSELYIGSNRSSTPVDGAADAAYVVLGECFLQYSGMQIRVEWAEQVSACAMKDIYKQMSTCACASTCKHHKITHISPTPTPTPTCKTLDMAYMKAPPKASISPITLDDVVYIDA